MEDLRRLPPQNIYFHELNDGSERGVFAIRWSKGDFSTLQDFRNFSSKYSSAMQALIQFDSVEEAEEWYFPEPYSNESAVESFKHPEPVKGDASAWFNSELPFAQIPWLNSLEHETLYIYEGGDFSDLVAVGEAGYLNVFVADVL